MPPKRLYGRKGEDASAAVLLCGNCGSRESEEEDICCEGPCRGWFHTACLSLPVKELSTMSSKEDDSSRTWICDRCLAISSSIQELLRTVKILSDRIQLLEAANADLSGRLELLESHETPKRGNEDDVQSNIDKETGSDADETSTEDKAKECSDGSHKASKKAKSGGTEEPVGCSQQKARRSTLYIRKIPISHQIEDIREQMRKCPGIPLKDLRVTQPLPNREFIGKWKYMSYVGPPTALETLTKTCRKGSLPWKMNTAPSARPTPVFRRPKRHASPRNSKTRRPSKASHPTLVSTTSQYPPSPTGGGFGTYSRPREENWRA